MKKLTVLGMGVCLAFAFSACKSSESAYKKAYEKAKQQELAEQSVTAEENVTPVVAPSEPEVVPVVAPQDIRSERVTVVSGDDGLKDYSVVCGSFAIKANADGLKARMENEGYKAMVLFNADASTYRVIIGTYDNRASAAQARDDFKARYPGDKDFQKAWLLYRVD